MRDRAPRQRRHRQSGDRGSCDAILAEQRKAAGAIAEAFFVLDEAFHRGLASAGRLCIYAWKVIEEAKAQMDRVRFLSLPHATPIRHLITQHRRSSTRSRPGAPRPPSRRCKAHLREILKSLPRLARDFPDMFETSEAKVT